MGIWDRTGTASVANGSTAVTGLGGTTWLVYARIGDRITFNGGSKWYEIAAVGSNTSITLATAFAETSVVSGPYAIDPSSYRHQVPSDILEQMRLLIASQTDLLETTGAPSPSLGADKSLAFDPAARVYYYKTNGVWGDPVSLGGSDGVDAGFKNQFSTATGMSDPGTGFVRFNNATRASVTAIAINDRSSDPANPDVSNYILTWDDSSNPVRGTIIFRKVGAPLNFAIFQITGALIDNAGWTQLTVTHVASGGTFAASDALSTVFIRAGDRGASGIDGVSAGPLFALSTNTTMADPGPGTLRFNNASLASATTMAIDVTSAAPGNPTIKPFLLTWDASTNTGHRGALTFTKLGAQENFAIFAITGALVDNTGWIQFTLAYVAGGGTLANGDILVAQFDRTGNRGADGLSAGFQYAFSTNTTIADPSAGGIRLNNGTLSAVTALAISDQTAETGNPSIAAAIAAWDDSTNTAHRGLITLRKLTAPQNFAQYFVNSDLTANSGWSNVPVTHLSSNGSFSNADVLTVEFTRTGNKGLDGTGIGDVLAANNLNDLANKQTAADNLSIHGADIASAATIDLDAALGTIIDITGTTSISTVTLADGRRRICRAAGVFTLVNGANLQVPGSADATLAVGDFILFVGYGSGVVRATILARGYNPNKVIQSDKVQTLTAAESKVARLNVLSPSFDGAAGLGLLSNPFFEVSQQNGTTAGTNGTAVYFHADEWSGAEDSDAVLSFQNVADPFSGTANFRRLRSSIKATATTPDASFTATQVLSPARAKIEGSFWRSLGWGTADARAVDIVFIAMCSVTGTYPVAIRNDTGARSYVTTVSLTANVPTVCLVTIPGDTSGTWLTSAAAAALLSIGEITGTTFQAASLNAWQAANVFSHSSCTNWAASGTTNFFQIAYAQIFPSGVLPFTAASQITGEALQLLLNMRRPFDVELARCQRYWQQLPANGNIGVSNSPSAGYMFGNFPVSMRAGGTATLASGSTITIDFFGVGTASSSSYALTGTGNAVTINANTLLPTRTANIPIICTNAINVDARL